MPKAPIAVFALLTLLLATLLLNMAVPKTNTQKDTAFPIIAIGSLDGKAQWQQDALKGRVTVLNFFASWCTPCAVEMPELAALKKDFPGIHLQAVAWNDKPDALNAWLKKYKNPFEQVWYDKSGNATIALGIRGIPETFIIDSKGVIRHRISGPLNAGLREGEIAQLLKKLLAEAKDAN